MKGKFYKTLIVFIFLNCAWFIIVQLFKIRPIIFPSPAHVYADFISNFALIMKHSWDSLKSILIGFLCSGSIAFLIGIALGMNRKLEGWLMHPLVLTQVVPKISIAPMILLWFGSGVFGKAIIAGLISFFPILTNTMIGISEIDQQFIDLFRVNNAKRIHELIKLRIPNSIIFILESVRLSFVYCIVGVITAEFIKPGAGLGDLILTAQNDLRTSLSFAAILAISCLGLVGWVVLDWIENKYFKQYKLSEQ